MGRVLKSRKMRNFNTRRETLMKIYDYKGRKNLCGNRVKEARARLKITQEDLAARLQVEGITMERDSVSRIEIGTRFVTDYELVVLARVLSARFTAKSNALAGSIWTVIHGLQKIAITRTGRKRDTAKTSPQKAHR